MSIDDEHLRYVSGSFDSDNPSEYDQMLETAKDLLGQGEAWVVITSVSSIDGEGQLGHQVHALLGSTPTADILMFIKEATDAFEVSVNTLIDKLNEEEEEKNGDT